jgi:bifunctional pyridoxal-dependent enzyme with beta-cystathionase and maltose regulon repressor activities
VEEVIIHQDMEEVVEIIEVVIEADITKEEEEVIIKDHHQEINHFLQINSMMRIKLLLKLEDFHIKLDMRKFQIFSETFYL